MTVSPTTGLSRLSISMPPTTRSQAFVPSPGREGSILEDDIVYLSSNLKYDISRTDERTKEIVRSLRHKSKSENREDPPELVIRTCREYRGEHDWYYTFQILEVVPYSIRIGSPDSPSYAIPKCHGPHTDEDGIRNTTRSKGKAKQEEEKSPCKHTVFLMDWIAKHTLLDHHPDDELSMTDQGWADEMGDIFQRISTSHLDILADSLHCDTTLPDGETIPGETRVLEAQQILALIAGETLERIQETLRTTYDGNRLVYRGDPLTTLYSLIIASHHVTALVRSQLDPSDPPLDPFIALEQRVVRIIAELDAYEELLKGSLGHQSSRAEGTRTTHPRDSGSPNVSWAAAQIQECVHQIKVLVSRGSGSLSQGERDSAARSLLRILRAVVKHNRDSFPGYPREEIPVDDRNLYARLIGNHDHDFVYSALTLLEDQTDYIADLEAIMESVEHLEYGSLASYNTKMRELISRMRSNVSRPSIYLSSQEGSPRDAPSNLLPTPVSDAGPVSGTSTVGGFLVPDINIAPSRRESPESRRGGRGSRGGTSSGGAGSKRMRAGTGDRDPKRAR